MQKKKRKKKGGGVREGGEGRPVTLVRLYIGATLTYRARNAPTTSKWFILSGFVIFFIYYIIDNSVSDQHETCVGDQYNAT